MSRMQGHIPYTKHSGGMDMVEETQRPYTLNDDINLEDTIDTDEILNQKELPKIEQAFDVRFEASIAKTPVSYLRKEIIKKTVF